MGLGIPGPSVEAKSKVDSSAFVSMMDNVTRKHPHVKVVATTLREVHSTNRHTWSAVAWIDGKVYNAPTAELDVIDRIGGGDGYAGYGDTRPFFWIGGGERPSSGAHVAFTASDRKAVDAFHAAAIAAGGKDNGGPGLRPHYHPNYYGAFVFDPDGNNVEAVCHAPE